MTDPIDVSATVTPGQPQGQNMALERRGETGLGRAMTLDELHTNLEFIRKVMRQEMKEGQDYGKIPGTGEKPTLLQPGAQKLLMTFNLSEYVKKETLREYPGFHREYEFTVTVKAPNGKEWDGVGTCSTLESKYRYRKAERICPECHKPAIIKGKEEYGGGWICFKKKGGCGQKYNDEHPAIISQSVEDVENEDPADCWNTCRKMAFKRALVAAAINATNTSELWTQDLEEMAGNKGSGMKVSAPQAKAKPQGAPIKTESAPKTPPPPADERTRARMIRKLADCIDLATEYFRKLHDPAVLMDNETLEQLPLEWVPITVRQFEALQAAIADFGNGVEAKHPYPPNPRTVTAETPQGNKQDKPKPHLEKAKQDPEWFWDVVITVPRKGEKKAEYDKHPDTIGLLYQAMKDGNEEAGHRLWGLAKNWDCAPREFKGKIYQPTDADKVCREALDAFVEYEEANGDVEEELLM